MSVAVSMAVPAVTVARARVSRMSTMTVATDFMGNALTMAAAGLATMAVAHIGQSATVTVALARLTSMAVAASCGVIMTLTWPTSMAMAVVLLSDDFSMPLARLSVMTVAMTMTATVALAVTMAAASGGSITMAVAMAAVAMAAVRVAMAA